MTESSLFGVSIRGWLALITVGSGLAFLYVAAFALADVDLRMVIITAVVGFVNLALGYYLGQKGTEPTEPPA
jgi:hypothetical protein